MNVRKSDNFTADIEQQFEWYAVNASWMSQNVISPPWRRPASFSDSIRNLGRRAASQIRAFAIGDSSLFPLHSRSMCCFTNYLVTKC